jgi:hypothetical protein
MTGTTHTCTVRRATGVCGKPAVYTWVSAIDGATYGECSEHYVGSVAGVGTVIGVAGPRIGDEVPVERHGKTYTGRIVRIGARGAVYAEVVYGNGATRTVRV